MTKLLYKVNGIEKSIDISVPPGATDARIVELPEVPEIGDLVRITKMHKAVTDQSKYVGMIGPVVAHYGIKHCGAHEILVGSCHYYVTGWEVLARKAEVLS